MITAPPGPTEPAAGVIVASPATAPVAKPTAVDLPTLIRSISSHTNAATDAAICVLMIAAAAPSSLAVSAEPPLKPNQPTHNRPAPTTVSDGLCGSINVLGKPMRLPSISATTNADTPAVVCTTMPPAKSITPWSARNPPPHTQRVTGT